MSTLRRGRSAIAKTTSESEETEESADMDTVGNTADLAVDLTGEQEVAGNGDTEKDEMIIDLEVKDSAPIVANPPGPTETAVKEESLSKVGKDESDVSVVATEPTDTGSKKSVDTNETAGPSTETPTINKAEPIKEESKPEAKPSTTAVVTKPRTKPLRSDHYRSLFPESLTKLRNLTVNIGPIRLFDLKSEKLHEILRMNDKFEIKFEMLETKESNGKIVKEKSGFIRLPFEITTPKYLIEVAYKLGHLHIDGRDMSVKFPEAFNTAVTDCKKYVEDAMELQLKNAEAFKRQISVKNVPVDVTEETVRALFPEAETITLKMKWPSTSEVGSVRLEFKTEKACIECLDTNKDVFIEDNQLRLFHVYTERKKKRDNRGRLFGRGSVYSHSKRGRGGFMWTVRGRGAARGRVVASARGQSASVPSSRNTSRMGSGAMGRTLTTPRGSRESSSYQGQFKDFNPANRQGNSARQPTGRGNLSYGQQGRDQSQTSSYRNDRSPQQRSVSSYRADTSYSPGRSQQTSSNSGEDPSAIMQYLQTTLARMEQKISSRDYSDRSHDLPVDMSRMGGQSGGMNRVSLTSPGMSLGISNRGLSNYGNQNRKRAAADNRDYGQQTKRQFTNIGGGNVIGTVVRDYRDDYQSNNAGNRSGAYGGSSDRTRRDSYGNSGRSDNFNTGYSGSQFTSSGGASGGGGSSGWGQPANMRGYN